MNEEAKIEVKKESKWFDKIKGFQKIKNIKHIEIVIAVIFAVIIILIFLSSSGNKFSFLSSNESQQATQLEQRLSSILSDIEGAGTVSVFVNFDSEEKITGVIVVSSGAENVKVKLDILRAVQTVITEPTTNIEILVGNK